MTADALTRGLAPAEKHIIGSPEHGRAEGPPPPSRVVSTTSSRSGSAGARKTDSSSQHRCVKVDPNGRRETAIGPVIRLAGTLAAALMLAALAGGPAALASFPGSNGDIAFAHLTSRGVDISAMRPDGTHRRLLTGPGISRSPAWSADGSIIVFTNADRRPEELCTMHADGTDPTCLTRDAVPQGWPAWSPDRRRIVYVFVGRRGQYEIATIRWDGTERRVLTRRSGAGDPDWSPDGSLIAFDVEGQIATMRLRGRGIRLVTTDGGYEPSWSPNGRWIAYADQGDLYKIRPDGTGIAQLTATAIEESWPAWSPNGNRVAYLRTRSNNEAERYMAAIWTISADGSDPVRVFRRVSGDQLPVEPPDWQPR
jgi:Tol biopolymer transport system component